MKNTHFFPTLVGVVMLFTASTAFAATDDYVNFFGFDEGTGRTVSDGKGGQNGSLTGSSTGFGWASGMIGTALGMDGLDGESVVLPDGFLKGSQGSVVLWFKMNTLSNRNIIFSGRSTGDNYIYFAIMVDYEGRPQLQFRTTTSGNDQKAQGSKILNKNEWYQLVLIANGQGYRMFINGEEMLVSGDSIGRWFPDLTSHTLMYRIGALSSNPLTGVFDGYLDDVRFYDRALTDLDVKDLYNDGDPGKPGNPVLAETPSTVTTTDVALNAPAVVETPATPATVTPPVTTPPQTVVAGDVETVRQAVIKELISKILVLIAELQKQLAALKAQGT